MTDDFRTVLDRYIEVNGAQEMNDVDDEYARRLFSPLEEAPHREEVLEAVAVGQLPMPAYVLGDGTTMLMYPEYATLVAEAGGKDRLRDWFVGQWDESQRGHAEQEWQRYRSGQYVTLTEVTPRAMQERDRLVEATAGLTATLDSDPDNDDARRALSSTLDDLDRMLLPLTGYDRRRFGGTLPREELVDEVRQKYLPDADDYRMTLSLNVLNHLGINLYSNLPAILSEAVANAWDADATRVDIDIDAPNETVTISDNGIGMTRREINQRYLNVGYRRREDEQNVAASTTLRRRPVMGRKGIGKLSLFSIAKSIEVQSRARRPVGDSEAELQRSALILDLDDIMGKIAGHDVATYSPTTIEADPSLGEPGTKLILTRPRKELNKTAAHLRRRLARRFAMVSDTFEIRVDGHAITLADRDLAKRCRYLWVYGPKDYRDRVKAMVKGAERVRENDGSTKGGNQVQGWIGSATTSTELKPVDEQDETLNRISVLVRGKLAQEDVLESIAQGGIFTKFLSGEIYADFLDEDAQDDIATSSRQGIVEDDPRFMDFKQFMAERIASIGTDWNNFREQDGVDDATKLVPAIEDWLKGFKGDTRTQAARFVARVNSIAADDAQRRQLLGSAVIAFERLRRRDRISEINAADDANLPALIDAFKNVDDVEAAMYFDIVQQRLEIIRKFETLTDDNALENILRDYLFEHLWLLDPAWDRATEGNMETTIAKLINKKKGPKDRVDIKYRKIGGEHVIVELKRAGRTVSTGELLTQTEKYRGKVLDALRHAAGSDVDVQVVCVVGTDLSDWAKDGGRERSRRSLAPYNTRVVMYQELVQNALQTYQAYLDANREVGAVRDVLHAMETQMTAGPAATDASGPDAAAQGPGDATDASTDAVEGPTAPQS
ncbi:DUF6058 family natural product biosynthesis protein [Janibacter sp. UYMM211]|uniref:BbrUII/HgiDII family restriction enzyme n=1 Tax=Janibacter sp. UYMM211 TaxID=3156342 RepID=UPI0033937A60